MKDKNTLPEKFCVKTTPGTMAVKREKGLTNLPFGFKGTEYTVFPKNDGKNGGKRLSHFSKEIPEGFELISIDDFWDIFY